MIQYLEIKNFENHAHAIFKDFSPDFNLICGPSDSGKSSVIRAIKVVAFNEFDYRCVRTGSKFCEITIRTEKGEVFAKRGKTVNEWEVTKKGQKKQEYKAVGKDVLEDAAEVIGLKFIKFNDMEVKVNVMDQLESHFMMASIEGKDASGSMRAQIIDEISGLSGIEPVIKEVSVDNLRLKKEITNLTDSNSELKERLHPEEELKKEEQLLKKATDLIADAENKKANTVDMGDLFSSNESVSSQVDSISTTLKSLIPDASIKKAEENIANYNSLALKHEALSSYKSQVGQIVVKNKNIATELKTLQKTEEPNTLIESANSSLASLKDMQGSVTSYLNLEESIEGKEAILKGLPDSSKALVQIKELDQKISSTKEMQTISNTFTLLQMAVVRKEKEVSQIPNTSEIEKMILDVNENSQKIALLQKISQETAVVNDKIVKAEAKLSELEESYHSLEKENQDILGEFEVCPFCDRDMEKAK